MQDEFTYLRPLRAISIVLGVTFSSLALLLLAVAFLLGDGQLTIPSLAFFLITLVSALGFIYLFREMMYVEETVWNIGLILGLLATAGIIWFSILIIGDNLAKGFLLGTTLGDRLTLILLLTIWVLLLAFNTLWVKSRDFFIDYETEEEPLQTEEESS